jgi:hypothetical protein
MSKLIYKVNRPDAAIAIKQSSNIWLCSTDVIGNLATQEQVDATTLPHPEGGGRRMLRQIPAGYVLIEVIGIVAQIHFQIALEGTPEEEIGEELGEVIHVG